MGLLFGYGPATDHGEAVDLLRAAYDLGVTCFDTAEAYGAENEELLGKEFNPGREQVVDAAQFGWNVDSARTGKTDSWLARIRLVAEHSLKCFQIDHIDLFYQRLIDPNVSIEPLSGRWHSQHPSTPSADCDRKGRNGCSRINLGAFRSSAPPSTTASKRKSMEPTWLLRKTSRMSSPECCRHSNLMGALFQGRYVPDRPLTIQTAPEEMMISNRRFVCGNFPTVIIVGGSIAGLMTALSLGKAGFKVTILERFDDNGRTGAALSVPDGTLALLTGSDTALNYVDLPSGVQSWTTIYAGLHKALESIPFVQFIQDARVVEVDCDADHTIALTDDGRVFLADVLIGADGHRSVVRRFITPEKPDASYAGYTIWLGLVDEQELTAPWPSGITDLEVDDYCFLGYPLASTFESSFPGNRRLGWAWYDGRHNDLMNRVGAVVGNVVQRTLRQNEIPDALYWKLKNEAGRLLPNPWSEAIRICAERRRIIGTPVSEYLPERLCRGHICMVGDAAHVQTPMMAMGVRSALADVLALSRALTICLDSLAPFKDALKSFETERLEPSRTMVESSQRFSADFVAAAKRWAYLNNLRT